MEMIAVGKPYSERTRWPEGSEYNYRAGFHELRIFFESPHPVEVKGITQGLSEFAFLVEEGLIFFLYQFEGGTDWSDCTFNIHRVDPAERIPPPEPQSERERAGLNVILVDAATGIVKGIRLVTFSPEFTRALHQAIREQFSMDLSPEKEMALIHRVHARYPHSEGMLGAARARCVGGVNLPG